ncbi:HTTM domain-containing protein [Streptomyces sp. NPDC049879]|uniref:HTTM domain-containing protein n=1 Tax=Streptomyces sp. NPDC049879 TaxID=3365598 RepID=UPI0037933235
MNATPTTPRELPPSPFKGVSKGFDAALARGIGHVTRRALGPYQTAIVRIGFAVTMLGFLLREWPHRGELYGPDSPWGLDLAARFTADNQAFSVLLWTDSHLWFELVYHLTILASVALLLGWRTRLATLLFMVGVLSLQNRSIFMGDGGDNVIHLMSMYLTLTRCARVWSLDARRAARTPRDAADPVGIALWAASGAALFGAIVSGKLDSVVWGLFFGGMWATHAVWWLLRRHAPGEPRVVADMIANLAHNAALLVIMCEVCLIYATAGWYKIQGSRWQDGTAVYYPMNLDYFTPWPWLTDFLSANGYLVLAMSYGTVFVQVGFVFALLNRRAKNVLLFAMVAEHLGIAVLMGLPFFSLAMIAMDSVFLPTAFLLWGGSRLRLAAERLLPPSVRRRLAPPPGSEAAAAPLPEQRAAERETAAPR